VTIKIETIEIKGSFKHLIDPSAFVRSIMIGLNDRSNLKQLKLKV
jgi:hypothetical protein